MAYLHANKPKPLLHRDLTSHNILLDSNLITKVADFGLSNVKQDASNKTYGIGQIPWMAPEGMMPNVFINSDHSSSFFQPAVLSGEAYTEKADVYSFGCILYELWTGHVPHAEMGDPVAFGEAIKTVRTSELLHQEQNMSSYNYVFVGLPSRHSCIGAAGLA